MVRARRAKEAGVIQGIGGNCSRLIPLRGAVRSAKRELSAEASDDPDSLSAPSLPSPASCGGKSYADLASAPSIMSTVFCTP